MTHSVRVSVIVPAWNGAKYVAQAVQSVLDQTYRSFEVIVVDDGSTDDTMKVLEAFGESVAVVKLPHRGISTARNAALAKCRGEYIALLDSDDVWEPNKLEQQVSYLDTHPKMGLVYSYWTNFTDGSDGVALLKKTDLEGTIFKDLVWRRGGFANSTIVVRRDVLDDVGYYDESLVAMEDYELNLRIARKYKIGRVPLPLMRRRIHPNSFYSSGYENQYKYQLPVFDKLLDDPSVIRELGASKEVFMSDFIHKFIYKCLYDRHLESIHAKLADLQRYSEKEDVENLRKLVDEEKLADDIWRPLIAHFDAWKADVKHKATLYKDGSAS